MNGGNAKTNLFIGIHNKVGMKKKTNVLGVPNRTKSLRSV
jgi:hypothetical protein